MKENREVTDTNVGDIEEAVKTMEHWVEYEKNNKDKINKADELIYIQETILSDYKKMLKEIEELKEKYDKDTHTLQNQLDIANADRVEKDKIIKLMAKYIADNDTTEIFCDDDKFEIDAFGDEVDCDEDCQECVLQYFK